VAGDEPVLVRVQAMCTIGDVFGSTACPCGHNLRHSLERIAAEGRGAVVYLQKEPEGGASPLRCARMREPDDGRRSTGPFRDYGLGAQILRDLGIRRLRVLTNSPKKMIGLEGYGLEVSEQVSIPVASDEADVASVATLRPRLVVGGKDEG